ncbi:MAG: amidase [Ignavibacteriales bacterium]|nr:amidase [Ignavibacteriales bacterium]
MSLPIRTLFVLVASVGFLYGQNIGRDSVAAAEHLIGLRFTDVKRDSMLESLSGQRASYENIRKATLPNSVLPAVLFNPLPAGFKFETKRTSFKAGPSAKSKVSAHLSKGQLPKGQVVPLGDDDLAFASVGELAELIRTRAVTSETLTRMYLSRLKKYGPKLECVVTLTESLAIAQARRADQEITGGKYRGLLHGIPYGVKDLLATKDYRTTWGSVPFKEQMIREDATVVRKLEAAGAVLVAKLTMGELAWGDVWFGGMTRNPWNYEQGSSGSSAGPASATAAGLVPFAIGTETWGSIVSPSQRCGTTGLRPTYGRVSRTGAMALSWSMDKIGPLCRSAEDCAIVFNAIYGPDGIDPTVYDAPFNYDPAIDLSKVRVGFYKSAFDSVKKSNRELFAAALKKFEQLGATLIPVELPASLPVDDLHIILSAEAGAAFDELTRSGKDDLLVRQIKNAWPNSFRASRFIPAVEYINANRVRTLLIQDMDKLMQTVDVIITPPYGGNSLLLTNLTGHPEVVLPNGFNKEGSLVSICIIGKLFDEATLLSVARKYQEATDYHLQHPSPKE